MHGYARRTHTSHVIILYHTWNGVFICRIRWNKHRSTQWRYSPFFLRVHGEHAPHSCTFTAHCCWMYRSKLLDDLAMVDCCFLVLYTHRIASHAWLQASEHTPYNVPPSTSDSSTTRRGHTHTLVGIHSIVAHAFLVSGPFESIVITGHTFTF